MNIFTKQFRPFMATIVASIACVSSAFAGYNDLPQFGSDASGTIIAVWQGFDSNGNYYIQSSSKTAEGNWATPSTISSSGHYATYPFVAVDATGNAYAIWTEIDQTTQNSVIFGAYFTYGGSWSTPAQLSDSAFNALNDYSIKLNEAGGAIALWSAYDNTYSNLDVYFTGVTVESGFSTTLNVTGS